MAKASRKVMTGELVISYPNVFTPRKNDQGVDKYSASLIFADGNLACITTDDGQKTTLDAVAMEIAKEAFGQNAAERIRKKQLKWPFRNGEEKDYPEGTVFFNASSNVQPGVVGATKDPKTDKARVITDSKEVYPGVVCRATLTCYSYDRPDSKGVTFGLNNLQVLRDGERLDNRKAATDEFEADDAALANLDDVTGEAEDAPPPAATKKAAPKAAAKKSSVLDALK